MINERGGVEGYKIVATYADAQSKTDVAINEAERLLNEAKVDVLMGVYSSAHCVPMAAKVDAAKKFMWANVCVASAVFKDKNLTVRVPPAGPLGPVRRGVLQLHRRERQGEARQGREGRQGRHHPRGRPVRRPASLPATKPECKELGMQIVHKEGYAATSTDLSALVTKLRRARPDVILHTGYNPDITLFLRQSKEAGLKFDALIGHGAGYGQIDKLIETFKGDVNYLYNVDPVAAQLLDPKTLTPGVADLTAEMVKRYMAETKVSEVPPHASMGFNQTWIFLTDVLPRAIKKHGGFDPEALRKAALETDIPDGGTIQGYGVKFFPPGHVMSGQNERSSPVVMQYVDGKTKIAWPSALKTIDPVLPLPTGTRLTRANSRLNFHPAAAL